MQDGIKGAVRLYGDPGPSPPGVSLTGDAPKPKAADSYLTTLLKLIPSEIVAGYVAIGSTWQAHDRLWLWFWLCFGVCFILRAYASVPKDQPAGIQNVQWPSVAVSCIAFYLWASTVYTPLDIATGAQAVGSASAAPAPVAPAPVKQTALFIIPHWHYGLEPWMAGGIALLFGALAAIVVPKDEQRA